MESVMDYDQWAMTYEPILRDGSELFETFGEDLEEVRNADPACVWTLIDGSEDDNCYIVNGYHLVNRVAYIITKKPFEGDLLEVLDD